jgi:signal transduction histidine kinase/CheY-like chemotaxis protein
MAHILVIDDRALNREFLATLLGYYGHTLDEAADGVEGLARVGERKPDLVITDLLMPNMDGEEFVRRLRADPVTKDLPVIIYTATYRVREAREIADRVGVRRVLAKPSEPKDIVAAVAEALGESAPAAQPPAPGKRGAPKPEIAAPGMGVVERLDVVESLNLRLAYLLKSAVQIAEEQAKSLTAVRALENALQNVQSLSLRLTGLVELGLDLAKARDPRELIDLFCRALQDILSSHYAGVVVIGGNGEPLRQFAARGLDDAARARVAREIADCPAAKRVLGQGGSGRLVISLKPSDVTGLPAAHPPVTNFLACPVAAHDKAIGWLYVADRLGEDAFSTDDGRIAMALGAQFATAWDSLGIYTELERLVAERTGQLEASSRELEAFSYSVSHDLRAPLRAIGGYTGILLRDHAGRLPADAAQLLEHVSKNVKRMGALIDDLLEFSRLGRKALSVQPVNLAHLARECLKELNGERQGRKVEIVIEKLPPCRGDVILLKQVLLNLLSNALKYTRKRDAARIEFGAEMRNGDCVCHVRDNGAGFDMRYADKLFEVFQRLHSQSEYAGTGVGLAIVRRAIEKHGGKVWAEAAPDQGATFYFSLPADNGAS